MSAAETLALEAEETPDDEVIEPIKCFHQCRLMIIPAGATTLVCQRDRGHFGPHEYPATLANEHGVTRPGRVMW